MPKIIKRPDRTDWYVWINGKRVSTGTRNYRLAERVAAELERKALLPADRTCDFETAAKSFIEIHVSGKRPGTQDMYEKKLRQLARVLGAKTPINEIIAEPIDAYTAQRRKEGAKDPTIGKELVALRGVLKLAIRHRKYIHSLDQVMPKWSSSSTPKERWCPPDEVWAIICQLPEHRGAVVAFHVATGSNWTECFSARREDVEGDDVFLRGTKREARRRRTPVYPWNRPFLDYALKHGESEGALFRPWPGMRYDLKRVCDRLGIPSVSSNDLRSSYGMWLRLRGVSPSLIGTALGHTDGRMAERRYAKVPVDKLRALIDMELRSPKTVPAAPNTPNSPSNPTTNQD